MGKIMKKYILLVIFTAIFFFVTGCGPGQPFEIEERQVSQSDTQIQVTEVR